MTTILIIDDEVNLRETICEMLTFVGYNVYLAQNGMEGLDKVKQLQPDLIICDVMMPLLDGYGFIKQHLVSKHSSIPVLFLSAQAEQKDVEKAIINGAKGFIKKPFLFVELKQQLDFFLLEEK